MIKKLRDGETQLHKSRPIQIAEDDALFGFGARLLDQTHLRVEIAPRLTVVDQAINPGPKVRIHRIAEFTLPPQIKWKIGIEMRKDNARQQLHARTFERKRNCSEQTCFFPAWRRDNAR